MDDDAEVAAAFVINRDIKYVPEGSRDSPCICLGEYLRRPVVIRARHSRRWLAANMKASAWIARLSALRRILL